MHPEPDQENNQGAKSGPMPVWNKRFAKNEMRQLGYFGDPGKYNQQRKAKSFHPKNRIPFFCILFHELEFAVCKNSCPEKVAWLKKQRPEKS
jgi:hypothetical protein